MEIMETPTPSNDSVSEPPTTLEKRGFSEPAPGDSFHWFRDKLRDATLLPLSLEDSSPSTAKLWPVPRSKHNFGVVNLSGCTVVIITSRYALYMGHFWERPSFEEKTGQVDRRGKPIYAFNERRFNREVLDVLAHGVNMEGEERTPGIRNRYFTRSDADTRVAIYTAPADEGHGLQFPDQIDKIKDEIYHLLPGLSHGITTRTYKRAGMDRQISLLDNHVDNIAFTEGKILVRFDPDYYGPAPCYDVIPAFQIIKGEKIRKPATVLIAS
ncbi:hypothetical protein NUU61_001279 [Penicillium alfredii]|uniref:Uncharacterized protein n=1 Tax=Penicillium alfredii TaxID=1506179 RepID=A0A9W9GCN9_9EURO|nr:uncharacterized protein NUU61_001279 [Penicillium alfredii]KAJ5115520.1 hypothetical protein NUU61_001279 [Penicillium alfredii]